MAIIPQTESYISKVSKQVLIKAALVLIIVFLIIIFLFLFKKEIDQRNLNEELTSKIEALGTSEDLKLVKEFNELKSKKEAFLKVKGETVLFTDILNMVEKMTLEKTNFTRFSFDLSSKIITLFGETSSYFELAEQIETTEKEEMIVNVTSRNINLDHEKNKVSFELTIKLK